MFSLFCGGVVSLAAFSFPDGLEYVAENLGFIQKSNNYFPGLFSEYLIPGIGQTWLASSLAGVLGVILVFSILFFLGRVVIYVFNQAAKN